MILVLNLLYWTYLVMKMIKLLVLRNGKMVKVPPYSNTGKVMLGEDVIGAVYSVSKDIYKNRRTTAVKKLLVDSIDTPSFIIKR